MKNRKLSSNELINICVFSIVGIGIILFMFVFIPDSVLYAKKGILRWLPFILIFGGIPFSIYRIIVIYNKKVAKLLACCSVFIVGPLFGYQTGQNEKIALKRDGIVVDGFISERWFSNKKQEWLVKAKFQVDSFLYESFTQTDKENIFKKNQPIKVIYSKRNPELNKIYSLYLRDE